MILTYVNEKYKEIERTETFMANYMKTFEIQNTNKIDELLSAHQNANMTNKIGFSARL